MYILPPGAPAAENELERKRRELIQRLTRTGGGRRAVEGGSRFGRQGMRGRPAQVGALAGLGGAGRFARPFGLGGVGTPQAAGPNVPNWVPDASGPPTMPFEEYMPGGAGNPPITGGPSQNPYGFDPWSPISPGNDMMHFNFSPMNPFKLGKYQAY